MTKATSAGDTNSPTLHVILGVPIYKHRRVGHDETVPLEQSGPEVIKKIMLNSAEHEIFPAHKC